MRAFLRSLIYGPEKALTALDLDAIAAAAPRASAPAGPIHTVTGTREARIARITARVSKSTAPPESRLRMTTEPRARFASSRASVMRRALGGSSRPCT